MNRPGLSALAYRVGTHGSFKQSMVTALGRHPALSGLTTRYDADPTLALLDGWASVLEVLTFYQERWANEQYLRTAVERRSILELARAIGYELGPGVAAGTYLAFSLDVPLTVPSQAVAASTPAEINLAIGTRAQSIPGPDELPQTFETVEETTLRAEWNTLPVRTSVPVKPGFGATHLYLAGTATALKPGDFILIIGSEREADTGSERWDLRRLLAVEPDPVRNLTRVSWAEGLGATRWGRITLPASSGLKVFAFRARAAIFGHYAQDWAVLSDTLRADYLGIDESLVVDADRVQWPSFKIFAPVYPPAFLPVVTAAATTTPTITATTGFDSTRRPLPRLTTDSIDLDGVYSGIAIDSWIVLSKPNLAEVFQVAGVTETTRAEYLTSGKVTRLVLSRGQRLLGEDLAAFADAVRETTVHAEAEELTLAEEPLVTPVSGSSVELARLVEGLEPGRWIALEGREAASGEFAGEVVELDRTETVGPLTRLVFVTPLRHTYQRDGLVIRANVVPATHGESRSEILGSGDGSRTFQSFALKFKPLTWVSAASARGIASTLEVRVNGVTWDEVDSLYGQGPEARVFVIRRADDGTVTVQFGDGRTGARLPTGQDNVTARYRMGIGTDALVKAGQISLLMSRPLGLKEVVNPEAPTGAADPETLDEARDNAPLTVLTLDRIVSLRDHEDFARAFAGIGKARATLLWDGEKRVVFLTVAGVDGAPVEASSALHRNLRSAIDLARHVDQAVQVETYAALTFGVSARIKVNPDYPAEDVLASAAGALAETFAFASRAFGQGVAASEVIAALQAVAGVEAVILDAFGFGAEPNVVAPHLPARDARWDAAGAMILPAELLLLDPEGAHLAELLDPLP